MFETGIIPPNANFHTPNPAIKWKEYKLRVPVEPEPLPARAASGRALVAMTSSGIGGSNASAVIQGSPAVQPKPSAFWRQGLAEVPLLFIAGGLSPRSTAAVGSDIAEKSQSWTGDAVGDLEMQIARAYGRRARSMTWRSFAVKKGETVTKFTEPILAPRIAPPVVFVFSGQGPQHYASGCYRFLWVAWVALLTE